MSQRNQKIRNAKTGLDIFEKAMPFVHAHDGVFADFQELRDKGLFAIRLNITHGSFEVKCKEPEIQT